MSKKTICFCDFCGRDQNHEDVFKMIQNEDRVHICDKCVDTCAEIIKEERAAQ